MFIEAAEENRPPGKASLLFYPSGSRAAEAGAERSADKRWIGQTGRNSGTQSYRD